MKLKDNEKAFFALVKAGLWEKDVRLSSYGNVDYFEVMRFAEEQSVVGLVTAGLDHVVDAIVPKGAKLVIIGKTLRLEQRNLAMNEFVAKLIALLRKEGIYVILVKGQGIAQCYERPLWRASGDVDLLLDGSDYEEAKRVLIPSAVSIEQEYSSFKHQGMTLEGGFVVELHGTQHSRLSKRVDRILDQVQRDVFYGGNVRSWINGSTTVFLPAPDVDVIFVFTHILHHFFFEGIGLRQICDWCRLLWTYRHKINVALLENRLKKMGILTEWRAFAALAVEYLGMPVERMPLYSSDSKWRRKAERVCSDILKVGNFGHNRETAKGSGQSYLIRKFLSFWKHLGFTLRHFASFPRDSIVFFCGVLRTGVLGVVRG